MHKQDKLKNFSILYSKLGCCRELSNQKEEKEDPFLPSFQAFGNLCGL
jgi:hypothetical protein